MPLLILSKGEGGRTARDIIMSPSVLDAQARGCIPGWTINGGCYKQLMSRTTQ